MHLLSFYQSTHAIYQDFGSTCTVQLPELVISYVHFALPRMHLIQKHCLSADVAHPHYCLNLHCHLLVCCCSYRWSHCSLLMDLPHESLCTSRVRDGQIDWQLIDITWKHLRIFKTKMMAPLWLLMCWYHQQTHSFWFISMRTILHNLIDCVIISEQVTTPWEALICFCSRPAIGVCWDCWIKEVKLSESSLGPLCNVRVMPVWCCDVICVWINAGYSCYSQIYWIPIAIHLLVYYIGLYGKESSYTLQLHIIIV